MKLLYIPIVIASLGLAACSGTPEEREVKRDQLVNLAVDRIERFNTLGVDPLQLEPTHLLALDTACITVLVGGVEVGMDEETLKNISAACEVIMKAAAPASAPDEAPMPEPAPEPAPE